MDGFAFNSAVLGLVHSMAHPLSAHCGIPHGVANAIALPYVMDYNLDACPDKFARIAGAMGLPVADLDNAAAGKAAVEFVKKLCSELSIPALSQRAEEHAAQAGPGRH
ncbi:MAG: iron-containing alcohol dehydrogenase [Bacillota bacterium]|uniref:hypothetical protein n=1 Tax=Desulforudis sp. DRI-14 TaxID=3459793 RepID=UPI00348B00F3